MSRKSLRNHLQNLVLILLTLSALILLTRLPLLQNIRLGNRVPLFSSTPSAEGQEEGTLPDAMFSSVNLMVTGELEYGRSGRLCVSADDAALQSVMPLFQEALGSAGSMEPSSDAAFRGALEGPGLYLELDCGALPLEAIAAWLGERLDVSLPLCAMALTIGEEDAVSLYLLDENGGIFHCPTALPVSAVRPTCDDFAPNGAYFAYETSYGSLAPYTVLTAAPDLLPDIRSELPAGYSAYNLLTALDFNAHTLSRYPESGGAEVVEESPRTLRIAPDGTVSLISRGENTSSLYRASGQGLPEILAAAWRLASALTSGTEASPLYLSGVEESEDGYTLRFRYQMDGVPVFFFDEGDALTVTYQEGAVTTFSYRCRVYTPLEEDPPALLPAGMAQAIAASYPQSALSIGYEDDGSGQLTAQWLR